MIKDGRLQTSAENRREITEKTNDLQKEEKKLTKSKRHKAMKEMIDCRK